MFITKLKDLNKKSITANGLRQFNLVAAGIYLLEAAAILALKRGSGGINIQTNFSSQDDFASQLQGHSVLAEASRHLFDFKIIYLLALGLIIAAVAHLLFATQYRKKYELELKKSSSPMRWTAYAISFGVISAAASLFFGVHQLVLLVIVMLSAAMVCIVASNNEMSATNKARSFWSGAAGLVAVIIPGLLMVAYLISSYAYGTPPSVYSYAAFLAWLVYAYLLLSFSFAAKHSQKNHLIAERIYLIMSLVALSGISWLIVAGIK